MGGQRIVISQVAAMGGDGFLLEEGDAAPHRDD